MTEFLDQSTAAIALLTGLLLVLTIGGWLAERFVR